MDNEKKILQLLEENNDKIEKVSLTLKLLGTIFLAAFAYQRDENEETKFMFKFTLILYLILNLIELAESFCRDFINKDDEEEECCE